MRHEFGKLIYELMKKDDKVVLICGDIGWKIFDQLRTDIVTRDRFLNVGICEQSMVSMAAGMALQGLKPWVYTITPFLVERAFEQVKLDIDQQNVNVKLVGYADYPHQGPTHSEVLTPVVLSRLIINPLLKNTYSFLPESSEQLKKIIGWAYEDSSPYFISLKKDRGVN